MVTISDRDTMAAIAAASVSPGHSRSAHRHAAALGQKSLSGSEPPASRQIPDGVVRRQIEQTPVGKRLRVASTERPVRSTYVHFAQAARHLFGMRQPFATRSCARIRSASRV